MHTKTTLDDKDAISKYIPGDGVRMKCVVAVGCFRQALILHHWTNKTVNGDTGYGVSAWQAELGVLENGNPEEIGLEIPDDLGAGVYVWEGDNKYPDDTYTRTGSLEDIFAFWLGEWREITSEELAALKAGTLWSEGNVAWDDDGSVRE